MIRRAENVTLTHRPSPFTGNGWLTLTVGKNSYRLHKLHKTAFAQGEQAQQQWPGRCGRIGDRTYYKFQGKFYWDNDDLTTDQVHALLVTRQQRETQRIDRAQAIVAIGEQPRRARRETIPNDVRQLVWTRDRGQCCHCGSPHELQYDHVIPVALGGGSSADNLQILCGPCNRRKGAGLTTR